MLLSQRCKISMSTEFLLHVSKLIAGIGIFVFAMYLFEESLKNLSGRSFKIFLQRITRNDIGAVVGGAIITALLQSSSMVSMMVLAFVGARIFTLRNAMAIILGANLGTTITGWIVATAGFKMNIEVIADPAIGIGGMMLILTGNRKVMQYTSYLFLGFGMLFIGLAFMKEAMEAETFNIAAYADMPPAMYVFIGFLITLLVQSSSVMMALALSALHAGSITFPIAAAIVLGSETGTSVKLLFGAMGNNVVKKRVALGNLLLNLGPTIAVLLLLRPMLSLILDVLHVRDPLIALVSFSTLFNLFAIFVFLPLLGPFTRLLGRWYGNGNNVTAAFLAHANTNEPVSALELFAKEVACFVYTSMRFNLELFEIDSSSFLNDADFEAAIDKKKLFSQSSDDRYNVIKETQGEIQSFYVKFREKISGARSAELDRLNTAARNSMYAVKSIKDVRNDISNLKRSSKDAKFGFFLQHKSEMENLYRRLRQLLARPKSARCEDFQNMFNEMYWQHNSALNAFYDAAGASLLQDTDMATAINFNREVFSANKAMLLAVKDLVLEDSQAERFNEMLVYAQDKPEKPMQIS